MKCYRLLAWHWYVVYREVKACVFKKTSLITVHIVSIVQKLNFCSLFNKLILINLEQPYFKLPLFVVCLFFVLFSLILLSKKKVSAQSCLQPYSRLLFHPHQMWMNLRCEQNNCNKRALISIMLRSILWNHFQQKSLTQTAFFVPENTGNTFVQTMTFFLFSFLQIWNIRLFLCSTPLWSI